MANEELRGLLQRLDSLLSSDAQGTLSGRMMVGELLLTLAQYSGAGEVIDAAKKAEAKLKDRKPTGPPEPLPGDQKALEKLARLQAEHDDPRGTTGDLIDLMFVELGASACISEPDASPEPPAEPSSEQPAARIVQTFLCVKCETRHCRPTIERTSGVTSDPPSQCLYRPGVFPNWQSVDKVREPEVAYRVTVYRCGTCATEIIDCDTNCPGCGAVFADDPEQPDLEAAAPTG